MLVRSIHRVDANRTARQPLPAIVESGVTLNCVFRHRRQWLGAASAPVTGPCADVDLKSSLMGKQVRRVRLSGSHNATDENSILLLV